VKERPIIICTELIPKVLDDSKTKTRRVDKLANKIAQSYERTWVHFNKQYNWWELKGRGYISGYIEPFVLKCPYGQVGDRLWVRETFAIEEGETQEPTDRPFKIDFEWGLLIPHYRATEPDIELVNDTQEDLVTKWKPSIHMPRWASRITLEITALRAGRLQGITEGDAIAEGFGSREDFRVGWNRLNAKWKRVYNPRLKIYEFWQFPWCEEDAKPIPKTTKHPERYHCCPNPWVWVIEFKRHVAEWLSGKIGPVVQSVILAIGPQNFSTKIELSV